MCDDSCIKSGYRFFKEYYKAHTLSGTRIENKLTFEPIRKLLAYDTQQDKLNNVLGEKYRYFWFDQQIVTENDTKKSIIVLIIEASVKVTNELYKVLSESYKDLFSSMYLGYRGISIIFTNDEKFEKFITLIKKRKLISGT